MMNFGTRKFVTLKGLNRRLISVDTLQVNFLEEHDIDGTLVTNIHLGNGKWVTAGLPLEETLAMLSADILEKNEDEEEKKREQKQLDSWRRMARARAESQKEINGSARKCWTKSKMQFLHTRKNARRFRQIDNSL